MKHLALFFGFLGGILLLFLVPRLVSHELASDSADAGGLNQQRLRHMEAAIRDQGAACEALAGTLESLALRIESLESRLDRQPIAASPHTQALPSSSGDGTTNAEPPRGERISPADFRALLPKVLRSTLDGTATEAEQQRFWQATRTTRLVDDTIEHLETQVEAHPHDTQARMELADAYVAKLLTVPAGPERGIWGMRAEKQWEDVVKQDPDHWDAQYTLAFNYSMYPAFLNKTDEAIEGFERALRIQERVPAKPQHAKTYVQLARMYGRKGDTKKAREILELGQIHHPEDKEITAALQAMRSK